jgi:hypothetical protein
LTAAGGHQLGHTSLQIRLWVRRRNQIMRQLNDGVLTIDEANEQFATLYDSPGTQREVNSIALADRPPH